MKLYNYLKLGKRLLENHIYQEGLKKNTIEKAKRPLRTDIINLLLKTQNRETTYLEIGVRNPDSNFNHVIATYKYSVDPGVEYKPNPVDFKMTSDVFFSKLRKNEILNKSKRFDVIFIDGLHTAEQVNKDIINSLEFIKEDGFIVLHDCNPPSEWHARESYEYKLTPADNCWNGTTWKAYVRFRQEMNFYSCCVDTDWGVGILSKKIKLGVAPNFKTMFYDYNDLDKNRKDLLNLISFNKLEQLLSNRI